MAETAVGTWAQSRPRHHGPLVAVYSEDAPLLGWRVCGVVDGCLTSLLRGEPAPAAVRVEPGEPFVADCRLRRPYGECDCPYRRCGIFGRSEPQLHEAVTRARRGCIRAVGVWSWTGRTRVWLGYIRGEQAVPLELELRAVEPPVAEADVIATAYGIPTWALANDAPLDLGRFTFAPPAAATV